MSEKRLSEQISDEILNMIFHQKRFVKGQKLPNENDLSAELGVSRMTLREAIRILAAYGVLEIRRGVGTFVTKDEDINGEFGLENMRAVRANLKELMEMRLVFEPETAYYAALRATDRELEEIERIAEDDAALVLAGIDRTDTEQAFHNSIAKASHNELMHQLLPIINTAVYKLVLLSSNTPEVNLQSNIDHKNVVEFLKNHDADGARTAMRLHMLHVMEGFGIERE